MQIADVEELLEYGCQIVIFTQGVDGVLQVPEETVAFLEERGVSVAVGKSTEAVGLYNDFAKRGLPVGALFHSTC